MWININRESKASQSFHSQFGYVSYRNFGFQYDAIEGESTGGTGFKFLYEMLSYRYIKLEEVPHVDL